MIRTLALPALIAVIGISYMLVSGGEPIGTSLFLIFSGASFVFMWTLLPTAANEGPTAPVDPDFDLERR
jgi:hypothetical protein